MSEHLLESWPRKSWYLMKRLLIGREWTAGIWQEISKLFLVEVRDFPFFWKKSLNRTAFFQIVDLENKSNVSCANSLGGQSCTISRTKNCTARSSQPESKAKMPSAVYPEVLTRHYNVKQTIGSGKFAFKLLDKLKSICECHQCIPVAAPQAVSAFKID